MLVITLVCPCYEPSRHRVPQERHPAACSHNTQRACYATVLLVGALQPHLTAAWTATGTQNVAVGVSHRHETIGTGARRVKA
jgi:hypothetical protein